MLPLSYRHLTRDQLANKLRAGDYRLPTLTPAGLRMVDSCATLLRHGATLPVWAYQP